MPENEPVRSPGAKSIGAFAFYLVLGVGNWMVAAEVNQFAALLTPTHIAGLLITVGTVGGAWYTKGPIRKL